MLHRAASLFRSAAYRLQRLLRRHLYRLPYILARVRSKRAAGKLSSPQFDAVFVLDPRSRGWILERISKEIAQRHPGETMFCYSARQLPRAHAYFVSHYALLPEALRENPYLHRSAVFCWYTHPRPLGYQEKEVVYALNHARKIFCPNSWLPSYLSSRGVDRERLTVVLGGADPHRFLGHPRGGGAIGFSMAYYARKRPDRVLEIARAFPERKVLLLGRRWRDYPHFQDLLSLPNFSYIESPYEEYPRYYGEMDVFVSPAELEGGPIPLAEAMMSNVVPVASDTGFARDLIRHGKNGYIFDVEASGAVVKDLVRAALANDSDVRRTVQHITWESFATSICKHMLLTMA